MNMANRVVVYGSGHSLLTGVNRMLPGKSFVSEFIEEILSA